MSFWLRQGAQGVTIFVHSFVRPVLVCLKLLFFIFWHQILRDDFRSVSGQSQVSLRSVSGQSQVSLKSVSCQSQVSLRSVSSQSQVSLRSVSGQSQVSLCLLRQ